MNPNTKQNALKDELLKQNGKTGVDQEVLRLHGIIESEQRRVRRLFWVAIAAWTIWIVMISVSLVVPKIQAHNNRATTTQMTAPAPAPSARFQHSSPGGTFAGLIVGTVLVAALIGLPILGTVLVIMLMVTRRTAGLNQVRASLAAIDAQLRVLASRETPGSGAEQG